MTSSVDQLKAALSALPSSDRAEIAHYLLVSLGDAAEEDVDQAWREELDHRIDDLRSGKVTGIPLETVVDDLRRRYP